MPSPTLSRQTVGPATLDGDLECYASPLACCNGPDRALIAQVFCTLTYVLLDKRLGDRVAQQESNMTGGAKHASPEPRQKFLHCNQL